MFMVLTGSIESLLWCDFDFIDKLLRNQTITINGGTQTRDFIYVTDIAETISKAVQLTSENKISETVNVLTGKSVSIDNLADSLTNIKF